MDYMEFILTVNRPDAERALELATAMCQGGLYVEDYADMEATVWEMAHVDLIEKALLEKPKDRVLIHLYTPQSEAVAFHQEICARLQANNIGQYTLNNSITKQEDWENSWKKYYHAMEIGQKLAVVPSWESYGNPTRTVLRLDPGMAFGTGGHETTALCLEILDECVNGGENVLDIGCGSGILGVAALLLGAGQALCIDIDPLAVRTTKENAQMNAVDSRLNAQQGDLAENCINTPQKTYDIILANIVADAILRLAGDIGPLLADGGLFIASGIIDERERAVAQGLEKAGLCIHRIRQKNGWVAFECGNA